MASEPSSNASSASFSANSAPTARRIIFLFSTFAGDGFAMLVGGAIPLSCFGQRVRALILLFERGTTTRGARLIIHFSIFINSPGPFQPSKWPLPNYETARYKLHRPAEPNKLIP